MKVWHISTSLSLLILGQSAIRAEGDFVTKFFEKLFCADEHMKEYEDTLKAYQQYDPSISIYSKNEDIAKSYRKLAPKYHPDKVQGDEQKAKFQNFHTAYETLLAKNTHFSEELNRVTVCISFYSLCAKMVAAGLMVQGVLIGHTLYKNLFATHPEVILMSIRTWSHKTVETLLGCSFDRYVAILQTFQISHHVNITPLLSSLPSEVAQDLGLAIREMDTLIGDAYEKIAWQYYDCNSVTDITARDPELVHKLNLAVGKLDGIIDTCKDIMGVKDHSGTGRYVLGSMAGIGTLLGFGVWKLYHDVKSRGPKFTVGPDEVLRLLPAN